MKYFTRSIFTSKKEYANLVDVGVNVNNDDSADEYNAACVACSERLEEIHNALPKSVRKLLDDPTWTKQRIRYVDDCFHIDPSEELTFLLDAEEYMFVIRYSMDSSPTFEAPDADDKQYFDTKECLEILKEEWDIENDQVVHRILLSNGYIVVFRPKSFHWWKAKVVSKG